MDLSQLWPVRQKLRELNRLKICHFLTQITRVYKSEQIYTVTCNYIFHENVSNVNPFSFQPDKTSLSQVVFTLRHRRRAGGR